MSLRPRSHLPLLLLLLPFLTAVAGDRTAWAARTQPPESIDQWTERARAASDRLGEQWSIHVEDLRTSRTIYQLNPELRLAPASCRKLFTTALALENLGPDFQFQTVLGLDRPPEANRVHYHGNLVLRSAGDPTFGGPFLKQPRNIIDLFDQWARKLRDAGIVYVHGDLVLDASAFGRDQDAYPEVWEPHHRNNAYAPVPSALTINQNVLSIHVRPGQDVGDRARVNVLPSVTGIRLINETRTGSRGASGVSAQFDEDRTTLRIRGRMRDGAGQEVVVMPLAQPLEYIGANLSRALQSQGVRLTGQVRVQLERAPGEDPAPLAEIIASHESPTLNRLLVTMIRESDNFLAEQIWLATAARVAGAADRLTARRIEQLWLNRIGLGWIEPGWDGCGLSRLDLVSAHELALVTLHLYRSVYRDFMLQALPLSGEQGTLRNRSFTTRDGRVQAKTGTLAGVSSLTGIIRDRQNQPRLIFSMIGNAPGNTDGRLAMRINELVRLLIEALDKDQLPRVEAQIVGPPAPVRMDE